MARTATAPQEVMVALASFVGAVGSTEVNVREGWLFAAADPIVKKYPTLFGPVQVRTSTTGGRVEQATAAPGEKRG